MKLNKKQKKVARIIKWIILGMFIILIIASGVMVYKHAGLI